MTINLISTFNAIPIFFFKTIGMQPYQILHKKSDALNRMNQMNPLFYVGFLNLFLLWVGEIIIFLKIAGNFNNFVDASDIAMCVGFISISFVKVITIFINVERMSKLMVDLDAMYGKTTSDQHKFNITKYTYQVKKVMLLYTVLFMTMIWCYNMFAFAETIIVFLRTGYWYADFPYIIWYPFDAYQPIVFEINYISQIWAGYVAAAATLSTDLLLCGTVVQVCMHLDNLTCDLLELRPTTMKEPNKRYYLKLIGYIKRHNEIIRMVSEVDDMFGISILFNFISSAVIICLLGFLATTAVKFGKLFKYAFTLISCTVQVFIVCWLGQKVIESSSKIGDGAYNSQWINSDFKYKKSLILIILRSQRSAVLRAYKFSVASLPRFSGVMSTAWSFFALLHSVYTK